LTIKDRALATVQKAGRSLAGCKSGFAGFEAAGVLTQAGGAEALGAVEAGGPGCQAAVAGGVDGVGAAEGGGADGLAVAAGGGADFAFFGKIRARIQARLSVLGRLGCFILCIQFDGSHFPHNSVQAQTRGDEYDAPTDR